MEIPHTGFEPEYEWPEAEAYDQTDQLDQSDEYAQPSTIRDELEHPRYELLPFKGAKVAEEWSHLPEGATVTVTCSAKFGQDRTLERAEDLAADERGFKVVPHLAARAIQSEGHLDEVLGRMDEAGITSAFIVGGDAKDAPDLPFHRSLDLVRAIRERKDQDELELGVTAYPDGHAAISREVLLQDLLDKQRMVGYCATQLCFSPRKIARWADEMQQEGLELPIKVGIPGDVERGKLVSIVRDVGINDATSFVSKNWPIAKQFLIPGGFSPDRIVSKLTPALESDDSLIAGFHINTFNAIRNTEVWRQRTLDALGPAEELAAPVALQFGSEAGEAEAA